MAPLQDLAEISRGFTSGADRFFCVHDVTQMHLDTTLDPEVFRNRWEYCVEIPDEYDYP